MESPDFSGSTNLIIEAVQPDPEGAQGNAAVITATTGKIFTCTNQTSSFKNYRGTWLTYDDTLRLFGIAFFDAFDLFGLKIYGNPKRSFTEIILGPNFNDYPTYGWMSINFKGSIQVKQGSYVNTITSLNFNYSAPPGVEWVPGTVPNDGRDHTFTFGVDQYGGFSFSLDGFLGGPYDLLKFSPDFHVMWTFTPRYRT